MDITVSNDGGKAVTSLTGEMELVCNPGNKKAVMCQLTGDRQ